MELITEPRWCIGNRIKIPAISAESESLKSLIWNTTKISVATVPDSSDSWRAGVVFLNQRRRLARLHVRQQVVHQRAQAHRHHARFDVENKACASWWWGSS